MQSARRGREEQRVRQGTVNDADATMLAEEKATVAAAKRERAAFAPLYDRYVDPVYHYATRRTGSHVVAQDVTSETFRRALDALERYEWQGKPFGAWLFQIAANVLREQRRAEGAPHAPQSLEAVQVDPPDDDPPAEVLLTQQEETGVLWRLVGEMPLEARRVLLFRFAWELSYAEISTRMGRSEAACKQLSYRALKDLRQRAVAAGYWQPENTTKMGA
jgi:RNA polymerase sigma-70 factor, ECF subfamily